MKYELKIVTLVGVAAALAGCASTPAVDPGLVSYAEVNGAMVVMAADYVDLADGTLLGTVTATPWADVPTVGSGANTATYNGFVGGGVDGTGTGGLAGKSLVGELEIGRAHV